MIIWCNVYKTVVKNSCGISPNCEGCVESEDYFEETEEKEKENK